MAHLISVTPIDEMDGDKHIVHPSVLVNPLAIRKIEVVEVEAPKPVVPKVEGGDKEPMAAPPGSTGVAPPVAPVLISMITFLDGKQMHVKETMAALAALVV